MCRLRQCSVGNFNPRITGSDPCLQPFHRRLDVLLAKRAFPDYRHAPTRVAQEGFVPAISIDVRSELGFPELGARRGRCSELAAFMPMPEAAPDLDDRPPPRENDVGTAGKRAVVESETEAFCMERAAQPQLGLRVCRPNARHHPRPRGTVYDIDHVFPWMNPRHLVMPGVMVWVPQR